MPCEAERDELADFSRRGAFGRVRRTAAVVLFAGDGSQTTKDAFLRMPDPIRI